MDNNTAPDSRHMLPILDDIVARLIDSCLMDDILAMHRAIKLGYFHVIAPEAATDSDCPDAHSGSRTVSGLNGVANTRENSSKSASCCRCVKCHSKVAATRFAPHLSNCMGLGRNSSRRANKRIAEQQRMEDFDDDADDDYIPDSVSYTTSLQPSASDSALSRMVSGNMNKQQQLLHSPLKMTISLVANKADSSTKHVVRSVNGASLCNSSQCPSSTSTIQPQTEGADVKLANPVVVLKDAAHCQFDIT